MNKPNKNSNHKVDELCHRVYWNIALKGWDVQQVVIREIKHTNGAYMFKVGDDAWTDSASLYKNSKDAIRNKIFRARRSRSIGEVDCYQERK